MLFRSRTATVLLVAGVLLSLLAVGCSGECGFWNFPRSLVPDAPCVVQTCLDGRIRVHALAEGQSGVDLEHVRGHFMTAARSRDPNLGVGISSMTEDGQQACGNIAAGTLDGGSFMCGSRLGFFEGRIEVRYMCGPGEIQDFLHNYTFKRPRTASSPRGAPEEPAALGVPAVPASPGVPAVPAWSWPAAPLEPPVPGDYDAAQAIAAGAEPMEPVRAVVPWGVAAVAAALCGGGAAAGACATYCAMRRRRDDEHRAPLIDAAPAREVPLRRLA